MNWKKSAPIVLRFGLSFVFLWFGLNQVFNPEAWFGWVPSWAVTENMTRLVVTNGALEIALGSLLLIGVYVRKVAFFLALHLIVIIVGLGYNDVAIRDFGLLMATISVFLYGADDLCYFKRG